MVIINKVYQLMKRGLDSNSYPRFVVLKTLLVEVWKSAVVGDIMV